jgi:hypothetical protein
MNTNDKMNPADAKPMHISKPVIEASQIKANTKVMCSENGQLGVVEAMDGKNSVKLKKDAKGISHFIPLNWVTRVDETIHLDRPGAQAMREWTTSAHS